MNNNNNNGGSGVISTLGKRGTPATDVAQNGSSNSAITTVEPLNSVELASAKNTTSLGSKRRKLSYPSLGTAPREFKPAVQKLVYTPLSTELLEGCMPQSVVKVFIALKHIKIDSKANLWGTNIYTDDSDIVAACIHDGSLKPEEIEKRNPPPAGAVVTLKIDGSQRKYPGNIRNGVKSGTWANYQGNSFSIIKVRLVDPDLSHSASSDGNNGLAKNNANSVRKRRNEERFKKLFLPNVTVVFNLSNEPCLKYSLNTVVDKGFEDKTLTSYRLLAEVMFVETHNSRFELSLHEKTFLSNGTSSEECNSTSPPNSANGNGCSYRYRWARVRSPHTLDIDRLSSLELPLSNDQVEMIFDELKWSEFQWSAQSVSVRGSEYQICRIQFCKRTHEIVLQSPTTTSTTPSNNPVDAGSGDNRAPTPQEDNNSTLAAPTPNATMDSTTEDSDSNAPNFTPAPTRRAKKGRGGRASSAEVSRAASTAASSSATTSAAPAGVQAATTTSSSDEMD